MSIYLDRDYQRIQASYVDSSLLVGEFLFRKISIVSQIVRMEILRIGDDDSTYSGEVSINYSEDQ